MQTRRDRISYGAGCLVVCCTELQSHPTPAIQIETVAEYNDIRETACGSFVGPPIEEAHNPVGKLTCCSDCSWRLPVENHTNCPETIHHFEHVLSHRVNVVTFHIVGRCVGARDPEWWLRALSTVNTYVQHTRAAVCGTRKEKKPQESRN